MNVATPAVVPIFSVSFVPCNSHVPFAKVWPATVIAPSPTIVVAASPVNRTADTDEDVEGMPLRVTLTLLRVPEV